MDINKVFGQVVEEPPEEVYKQPSISPFEFINSINYTKEDIIVDDWSEKQYNSYVINRGLSFGSDTVIQANEMNSRPHLDKKLQYQFLINIIRPRKRYNKWLKADKIDAIEVIKTYYGYSTDKARQALSILNPEQIDKLKQKLKKGGL
jgi:hypothetical protein